MNRTTAGGVMRRLRAGFPERELFVRSQGQVRFIRISSRLQMAAAGVLALLLLVCLGGAAATVVSGIGANRARDALRDREARVARAEHDVSAYRRKLDAVSTDLERRQDFIEKMVDAQIGELPAEPKGGEAGGSEAAPIADKISAVLPEARGLARVEARQLAFVERLTQFAELRASSAREAIRMLGLNPRSMMAVLEDRGAQGGPLLHLATSADGSLDPRFRRLGTSLARMNQLERGLAGIPQVLPASMEYISSGFGYRSDPFTGEGAFHAGLDFAGPRGAPVYAAAKGRVIFVGQRQGYGNCVEIDHGNGLVTRYAHMSAFRAHVGQAVRAGEQIGAIGSTGRSTGPHLHFEVRSNDRPVNPRPFLEAAPKVLEEVRSAHLAMR